MHKYQFSKPLEAYLEVTGIKDQVLTNMEAQQKPSGDYAVMSKLFSWRHSKEGYMFWEGYYYSFLRFESRLNLT